MTRSLALVIAASLALAGCSAATPTTAAKLAGAKGIAAKGQIDDVLARIDNEGKRAADKVGLEGGLAAVLSAPTDVMAQRGLVTWYGRATAAMMGFVGMDFDERVGELMSQETIAEHPEVTKPEVREYVQKVANRLTTAAKIAPYKTFVVTDDTVNASNAGGHFMIVHSALVAQVSDEAELAGVLAHEIVHGQERHMIQNVSRFVFDSQSNTFAEGYCGVQEGQMSLVEGHFRIMQPNVVWDRDKDFILSYLSGKVTAETMKALVFKYNSYFADRTMDRDAEFEADTGSTEMLAAAGYDPEGLVRVIDRWNDHLTADIRYNGHPSAGDRVGNIRSVIKNNKLAGTDRGADRLAPIKAALGKQPVATIEQAREDAAPRYSLGTNPWLRAKHR